MASAALRNRDTEELIAELARTQDESLRGEIIERHEPLVRSLAHKFVRAGVQVDDLIQTAWIALIRALDRYDPSHETKFSTYAIHCMVGEIKRYFRDRTWGMKVPRFLQEIASGLNRMEDQLLRELGREPTMAEMAASFGVTEEDLAEAMELQRNYQMPALEDRFEGEEGSDGLAVGDTVGSEDPHLTALIENASLQSALARLERRDQFILRRRFYEGFSQQEVASELGLSQMHISRLERAALRRLRASLCAEEAPAPA
jgi:RNA polymerase sigma-B factor